MSKSNKNGKSSDDLLLQMQCLHPLKIDLSLERIERLLAALDHPEGKLPPVIHIAGTNGKGSTLAFLKAMFEAAGNRVGSYTSPHLIRFHERITLPGMDGKSCPISEDQLVDVLTRTLATNAGASITFFEITTAAAFLAFAAAACDVVLLETGLGGRFDTTNVVTRPAMTIITPISMDHIEMLGDSLARIAREKAGILKPGVPAVIAQQPDEAMAVIEQVANSIAAPLFRWGHDFDAYEQSGRLIYQSDPQPSDQAPDDTAANIEQEGARSRLAQFHSAVMDRNRQAVQPVPDHAFLMDLPLPALAGRHQIRNAGLAVATAMQLRKTGADLGLFLSDDAIERGLVTVRWPARLQRLTEGPLTQDLHPQSELWLDGGHNEAAGQMLAQAIADLEERSPKPLIMIVGMLAHKDVRAFLTPFQSLAANLLAVPVSGWHTETGMGGTAAATQVMALAQELGFESDLASDVSSALTLINKSVEEPARILICGSLYLAGDVLQVNAGSENGSCRM